MNADAITVTAQTASAISTITTIMAVETDGIDGIVRNVAEHIETTRQSVDIVSNPGIDRKEKRKIRKVLRETAQHQSATSLLTDEQRTTTRKEQHIWKPKSV